MKKLPLPPFKLFVLLLFIGLQSFADNVRGGYISYTHTSGNTYHFKIFTYTDPTEVAADRCSETIILNNIGGGANIYLNCTRTNTTPGVDLTNLNPPLANCPNSSTTDQGLMMVYPFTHTCPTTTNYGGIKLNIYEADYTFSGNGIYSIGMIDPNISVNVNNVGSGNSNNITFALVDTLSITNLSSYNNSPISSNSLVDSVYRGQTFNYNLNLTDVDGDSLSYSLTPFITGDTTGGFYAASGSFIPAGMVINAVTGNLSWPTTATNCQYGLYDVDVLVKEYRRVGGVMTEIGNEVFSIQIDVICNTTGINKLAIADNQITVYPNPANDQSIINISLSRSQQISLELYDIQGSLVKTIVKEKVTERQNQYQVSLLDVTAGTYFYRLITEDGISEKKLVVIK
ncbi:MAG TPA: T9SS type A sorting domain-containing protein [Bacteroidia bacterium]|jgi:hypothetical protein|nr:T9SS type A sorting domain-containing protein [Bacteroidia bacterium]